MNGAADLLSVALIVAVARGIQVIMNDGMITATILHWGEEGLKGLSSQLFIVLTYIFYLPMSFLIHHHLVLPAQQWVSWHLLVNSSMYQVA